jgi:aspartate beta-hydroxylase
MVHSYVEVYAKTTLLGVVFPIHPLRGTTFPEMIHMSLAYDSAVGFVRSLYDRSITTPSVLDTIRYFPNAKRFTERWLDIRSEALAAAAELHNIPRFHDIMPEQRDISANDGRDWRVLILKAYGVEMPQNLHRCPTIASLVEQTPEAVSCVLSFLAPGKHIPVHRGPFRGIMRFHLMLSMPLDETGLPACVMEIDSVPYRLANGESLLWDDTYPHEVWNRSSEVRVALLLDVWRKGMPLHLNLLSRTLMGLVQVWMGLRGVSYGG